MYIVTAVSLGLRSISKVVYRNYRRYSGFLKGFFMFGCLMVLNICFTSLWELSEFDLYSYLGNLHVLVAMFDLVYHPVFWVYFS